MGVSNLIFKAALMELQLPQPGRAVRKFLPPVILQKANRSASPERGGVGQESGQTWNYSLGARSSLVSARSMLHFVDEVAVTGEDAEACSRPRCECGGEGGVTSHPSRSRLSH